MGKKKNRFKRRDVRKKRQKLIEKKRKQLQEKYPEKYKKKIKEAEQEFKTEKEKKLEVQLQKETNLYWTRAITGGLSALIGRLFLGLVGWWLLIWMLAFWFGFPFLASFIIFRYDYDEEEWNWKNIIKPGIGIYFFLFMIVGVFIHTILKFL